MSLLRNAPIIQQAVIDNLNLKLILPPLHELTKTKRSKKKEIIIMRTKLNFH
jgi:hypothetical protein